MINGIDVSKWQGTIDWPQVAAAGYQFAGIRASVGNYYNDPFFEENYDGAVANGILPLPYHVLRPDNTVQSQVDKLLSTLDGRKPASLVLDVEVEAGIDVVTIRDRCYWVLRHMGDYVGEVGRIIIYTADWFWSPRLSYHVLPKDDGSLPRNTADGWHLWVASYGNNNGQVPTDPLLPTIPSGWRLKDGTLLRDWSMWQYTSRGAVPGIGGNVDLNLMRDVFFEELTGQVPAPPPPEPPSDLELRVQQLEQKVTRLDGWADSYVG